MPPPMKNSSRSVSTSRSSGTAEPASRSTSNGATIGLISVVTMTPAMISEGSKP